MKYLAIDYGTRRIGLAISESGYFSTPIEAIKNKEGENIHLLLEEIEKMQPENIILGNPVNDHGQDTDFSMVVKNIGQNIKAKFPNINIFYTNEFLTSLEAKEQDPSQKNIDSYAAAIILDQYINENTRK